MAQFVYLNEQGFRDLMKQAVREGIEDAWEVLQRFEASFSADVDSGLITDDTRKQIETFVAVQFIANYIGKIAIQGVPIAQPTHGPVRLK